MTEQRLFRVVWPYGGNEQHRYVAADNLTTVATAIETNRLVPPQGYSSDAVPPRRIEDLGVVQCFGREYQPGTLPPNTVFVLGDPERVPTEAVRSADAVVAIDAATGARTIKHRFEPEGTAYRVFAV